MKRCPPGVICVENLSMTFLFLTILFLGYLLYLNMQRPANESPLQAPTWSLSMPYTNLPSDPLLNPYAPPLRDERYFMTRAVPINVSTNVGAVDTAYRQVGILTPANGSSKDSILPLMGRPVFTNRDKWQYYSTSNQHNNVKLPVSRAGKSCTNEYGCDRLYTGDQVYVEGANDTFRVTVYDNDTIKYLPFF